MMYLFLLGGDVVNLAACPIRRLETSRVLGIGPTSDAASRTSDVVAWFVDGSSERLAHFTHEHHEEMAKEFISLLVTESLDRAHRGIGALYVEQLVGLAESAWTLGVGPELEVAA